MKEEVLKKFADRVRELRIKKKEGGETTLFFLFMADG